MKRRNFISLILIIISFSTSGYSQVKLEYDSLLNDSFLSKNTMIYPWWIITDDSGRITSIFTEHPDMENVQNQKQLATSKTIKYFNSDGEYYLDTLISSLSKANFKEDTLSISLEYFPPPHYKFWNAKIYKGNIVTQIEVAPSERSEDSNKRNQPPTSSHSIYSNERVILNKINYKKGDLLIAKIYFEVNYQYNYNGNTKISTSKYYGIIKCIVN